MNNSTLSASRYAELHGRTPNLITLDVRSPGEYSGERLDNCHNLPLQALEETALKASLNEQDCEPGQTIYFLCQAGQRAKMAAEKARPWVDNPFCIIEGGINELRSSTVEMRSSEKAPMSLERQVRVSAGSLVLCGAVLGYFVNPAFYGLSAFVGAGLVFAGLTDTCAMGMLLARMPWNTAKT